MEYIREYIHVNDGDSAIYIKQPHNADSFAGVAPQGPLVVAGDKLLLPGGRSVPACYDRKTGTACHPRFSLDAKARRSLEALSACLLRGHGARVQVAGTGVLFRLPTSDFRLAPTTKAGAPTPAFLRVSRL